jgi:hypothetical protein
VTHFFENFNLTSDALHVFLVVDLFFFEDFDGNLKDKQKLAKNSLFKTKKILPFLP